MVIICDSKVKKERIRCITDYKKKHIKSKGNIGIHCGNVTHEKSISEVIQ